uniref:Uncharacterized protein n=1 Tax=Cucumis melo TaxID=3656 RepID=A0A9I9EHB1_CUCME
LGVWQLGLTTNRSLTENKGDGGGFDGRREIVAGDLVGRREGGATATCDFQEEDESG